MKVHTSHHNKENFGGKMNAANFLGTCEEIKEHLGTAFTTVW